MDYSSKIVTEIPIKNLWNDSEEIYAKKTKTLNQKEIQEILKKYPVEFVVANIGEKLKWIEVYNCYEFWKTEPQNKIIDNPDKIELEEFKNHYGYLASEWIGEIQTPIILLEKYH